MKPIRLLMTVLCLLSLVQITTPLIESNYEVQTEEKKWTEAKKGCRGLGHFPILAEPMTKREVTDMNDNVTKHPKRRFWIGLRKEANESCFKWQDGSLFTLEKYDPWNPWNLDNNQPNVTIVPGCVFQQAYKWTVARCVLRLQYVCQKTNPPDGYPVLRINGDPVNNGEQVMLRQGSSYCASCSVHGGNPSDTYLTLTCEGHDIVSKYNLVETSAPADVDSQLDGKACVCQADHVSRCYTKNTAGVKLLVPQCSYQKYGMDCSKSCSNCKQDCDKVTGECLIGCYQWKYPKTRTSCQHQETSKPRPEDHDMFDPNPAIIGQPMDVLCNVKTIGGKEMLPGINKKKMLEKVSLYQSTLDGSCEMIAEYEPSADGGHKVKGYLPKSSLIIMDEKPADFGSSITSKILLVIFKAEMEHITEYTCKINYFTVGDPQKTEEVVATQKPAFKNETQEIANVDDVDDSVVVGGNDVLGNHTGEVNTTQKGLWTTKAPFHEKSDWQAVMVYGGLLLIASVVLCCCLCCGRREKNNEDKTTTGETNGKTKPKRSTSRQNGKSGAKRASSEKSELERLRSLGSSVDLQLSTSTESSDSSYSTTSSSE